MRAVFFDKDGTLIENVPYNIDPERIHLMAGAAAALRLLSEAGYQIVVVSNQPGIARGLFDEAAMYAVEKRLSDLVRASGASLGRFYWCPHHPAGRNSAYAVECACRKPAPGMLMRAARDFDIDLGSSWMVGDILDDVEAGHRAGCRAILVDNGGETEWVMSPARAPDFIAPDLAQAAAIICEEATSGVVLQFDDFVIHKRDRR